MRLAVDRVRVVVRVYATLNARLDGKRGRSVVNRQKMQWLRAHLGSIVACAAILVVAGISAWWLDDAEAWGAFGQWAGAFGAVLAVTVALRIAQREAERETERRREEKADYEAEQARLKAERELEQARLVVAELKYPTDFEQYEAKLHSGEDLLPEVAIINYSTTHVFHPRVEGFVHQAGGSVTWDIEADGWDDPGPATILPSGGSEKYPFVLQHDPPITEDMYPIRTKVIFGFTDADGRRWRRFAEGKPVRVEEGDTFETGGPDWYRADK